MEPLTWCFQSGSHKVAKHQLINPARTVPDPPIAFLKPALTLNSLSHGARVQNLWEYNSVEEIQKQLFYNGEEECVYWHVGGIDVCGINGETDTGRDVSLEDLNHNVSHCTHTCFSSFFTYLLFCSFLQHTLLKGIKSLCKQKSETEQNTVKTNTRKINYIRGTFLFTARDK